MTLMNNASEYTMILSCLILLSSCSLQKEGLSNLANLNLHAYNPRSAITSNLEYDSARLEDFKFYGVRPTPDGKMAGVYSYFDTGSNTQPGTYYTVYAVVEQVSLFQWQVTSTYAYGSPSLPHEGIPIDYIVLQTDYTAVFGPIFSDQVSTVEVSLVDGTRRAESILEDYFLIFISKVVDVCQIQAFDAGGESLYRVELSKWTPESNECP
jgi:hypothetical protein